MLTEAEERAYTRLAKFERRRKLLSVIGLVGGLGIAAVAGVMRLNWEKSLLELTRNFTDKPISGAEVYFSAKAAVILAGVQFLLPIGFLLAGWAVGRWSGDPSSILLLGLVKRVRDERQTPAA